MGKKETTAKRAATALLAAETALEDVGHELQLGEATLGRNAALADLKVLERARERLRLAHVELANESPDWGAVHVHASGAHAELTELQQRIAKIYEIAFSGSREQLQRVQRRHRQISGDLERIDRALDRLKSSASIWELSQLESLQGAATDHFEDSKAEVHNALESSDIDNNNSAIALVLAEEYLDQCAKEIACADDLIKNLSQKPPKEKSYRRPADGAGFNSIQVVTSTPAPTTTATDLHTPSKGQPQVKNTEDGCLKGCLAVFLVFAVWLIWAITAPQLRQSQETRRLRETDARVPISNVSLEIEDGRRGMHHFSIGKPAMIVNDTGTGWVRVLLSDSARSRTGALVSNRSPWPFTAELSWPDGSTISCAASRSWWWDAHDFLSLRCPYAVNEPERVSSIVFRIGEFDAS